MFARIKNVFNKYREDRRLLRELLIKLDNLTDPTFLARASWGEWRDKNGFPVHHNCRCIAEVNQ